MLSLAGCDQIFTFDRHPPPDAPPDAPQVGRWRSISAGGLHTCGIDQGDRLFCWGDNSSGQLGRPPGALAESAGPIPLDGTWASVTTGPLQTCAITRTDASLWCWGNNEYGQVGNGTTGLVAPPTMISAERWLDVSTGFYVTCGIVEDGTAYCWGVDSNGAVGNGSAAGSLAPTAVAGGRVFTSITVGLQHACAIEQGGALWCWGYNGNGQIGDGTAANRDAPVEIEAGTRWLAVAGGDLNTCGLRDDGRLRCWGQADSGQIGDGTTSSARYIPQPVGLDDDGWVAIEVGAARACGRRADGVLLCWGRNDQGQLAAMRALAIQSAPVEVPPKRASWKTISLGDHHACLIDAYDNAWCSGNASRGQLGNGVAGSRTTPARVDGDWLAVDAGPDFTCATTVANQLRCWGNNHLGQLGDGSRLPRQTPVRAAVPTPVTNFDVGHHHTLARRSDELWGFGYNAYGQLGNVSVVDSNPVMISNAPPPPATGTSLLAAGDHTCALGNSGAVQCWGRNDWAQLGRGAVSYVAEPTPTAVAGTTYRAVAAGLVHTCAIASQGVYCWGINSSGQIGDGTGVNRLSPTTVAPPPDHVAAGYAHTCTITGQSLACWGGNYHGELGISSTNLVALSPTAVSTPAVQWSSLARSLGEYASCAIAADASLYCWGRNHRGQLGIGSFTSQLAPARVDDYAWQSVAMGAHHACGVRADRSLWCWGDNRYGQLGDGGAWRTELVEVLSP